MTRRKFDKTATYRCCQCEQVISDPNHTQRALFFGVGRMYCGDECSRLGASVLRHDSFSQPDAQARFKAHAQKTLPAFLLNRRGGKVISSAQQLLFSALGPGWTQEHAVNLGKRTRYSIDLANVAIKLAVECDGHSHCGSAALAHDHLRDARLRTCGWVILRFTNTMIIKHLDDVVSEIRAQELILRALMPADAPVAEQPAAAPAAETPVQEQYHLMALPAGIKLEFDKSDPVVHNTVELNVAVKAPEVTVNG